MNRYYILKYKREAKGILEFWKEDMGITADIINFFFREFTRNFCKYTRYFRELTRMFRELMRNFHK